MKNCDVISMIFLLLLSNKQSISGTKYLNVFCDVCVCVCVCVYSNHGK
jgi:hypothetical protein